MQPGGSTSKKKAIFIYCNDVFYRKMLFFSYK